MSLRVGSLFGETVVLATVCSCIYREDDLCIVIETLVGFKLEGFQRDQTPWQNGKDCTSKYRISILSTKSLVNYFSLKINRSVCYYEIDLPVQGL